MVRDSGEREVGVPPTIKALLAARLDQLDPAERDVLERGSVEGQLFHRGAVEALATPAGARSMRQLVGARPQGARPARPRAAAGRGRLPLPPPADPRRRLRRAPEGDPSGAARALRATGSRQRGARSGRARRDRRLPPRAGLPLPGRARPGRRTRPEPWPAERRRCSRAPGAAARLRGDHPGAARGSCRERPRFALARPARRCCPSSPRCCSRPASFARAHGRPRRRALERCARAGRRAARSRSPRCGAR